MMNVATRVIHTCGGSVRCSISSPDLGCPFFSPVVIELADVSGSLSLGLHLGKPLEGVSSDLDQAVRDIDAVPISDVAVVIDALKADFKDSSVTSAGCPLQAPTSGVVRYIYALISGFSPTVRTGATFGRDMQRSLQFRTESGLVVISCLLLLVAVLRLSGLAGSAHFTVLVPWVMKGSWSLTVHLWWLCRLSVLVFSLPPPLPCTPFLHRVII